MFHIFHSGNPFSQSDENTRLKNILAVLIIKIVLADNKSTKKEQKAVLKFFNDEFSLSADETKKLLNTTNYNDENYTKILTQLEEILHTDDSIKAKLMSYINSIIICDGLIDEEYEVFETIKIYLA